MVAPRLRHVGLLFRVYHLLDPSRYRSTNTILVRPTHLHPQDHGVDSLVDSNFFLMSTVMLICPIGLTFFISLLSPKFHVWSSSDPPGTPMKPAVFYCIEDVAAVDFMHGREYRKKIHARCVDRVHLDRGALLSSKTRYHASPPFRQLMLHLTVYWTVCSLLYCGVTALVSWLTPLEFAFAWVLGQMFVWGAVCSLGCRFIVKRGLRREREWWARKGQNQDISVEK